MKHTQISSLKRIYIYVFPEHTEEKLESETLGSNPSTHPPIYLFIHPSIYPSIQEMLIEDLLCPSHWGYRW